LRDVPADTVANRCSPRVTSIQTNALAVMRLRSL
jgi:hypothetical protein